ncbi:unnamed protein product [Cochlearia groenlandica]
MGGGAIGSSDRENFSISGPCHLTSIDWTNMYHRTTVTSSLVKSVYVLQLDNEEKRVGLDAKAKPWFDFFHFTLLETLIDQHDSSIYGAIFEYKLNHLYQNAPHLKYVPRYVIAFRGTNLGPETRICDVKLDIRCFFNCLDKGARFLHAVEAIRTMVAKHKNIWLAGHSLGAGLALLAGKTMIKDNVFLETYIYNPPISSMPLEKIIKSRKLKGIIRIAESVVKGTLALVLKELMEQQDDPKTALWIPYIYVNPFDIICSEYIGYFKHKTYMCKIGASEIETHSSKYSVRSRLSEIRKKGKSSVKSTEPIHHLSAADMIVNRTKSSVSAHGLQQWWEQDSALRANWESHSIRPYTENEPLKTTS